MRKVVANKKTPIVVRNKLTEMLQVYCRSFSQHRVREGAIFDEIYREWQKKGIHFPLLDERKIMVDFQPPRRGCFFFFLKKIFLMTV